MQLTVTIKDDIFAKLNKLKTIDHKTIDEEIELVVEEHFYKTVNDEDDPIFHLDDYCFTTKERNVGRDHDKYIYD